MMAVGTGGHRFEDWKGRDRQGVAPSELPAVPWLGSRPDGTGLLPFRLFEASLLLCEKQYLACACPLGSKRRSRRVVQWCPRSEVHTRPILHAA